MNAKTFLVTCAFALSVSFAVNAGLPVIVALDNADFPAYAPQPNHNWSPINGGFGYNPWTPLSDVSGGGTYMEGVGVNGRQVEGNYSFALYSGSGAFDISRPLSSSIVSGEFDIITRFDIAGSGPNLVNLRAGNNTASFASGELLSFGLIDGNSLTYTDSSGLHSLPSGESRGSVWAWNIDFNAAAGTYSASVTNLDGGFAAFFSGNLEASATSVGSFAVINSSTGNNQNVIFDVPTFSVVPEPSVLSLAILGLAAALLWRPRPFPRAAMIQSDVETRIPITDPSLTRTPRKTRPRFGPNTR
jgi:hypothetical protein